MPSKFTTEMINNDFFVNAKGLKNAIRKVKDYLQNQGFILIAIKDFRISKCDEHGDNYWFDLDVRSKND